MTEIEIVRPVRNTWNEASAELCTECDELDRWHPEIEGWSRDILPFYKRMADALQDGSIVVEVGVHHGRSILYLAERLFALKKNLCELAAVDPCIMCDWGTFDANCGKIVGGTMVKPVPLPSLKAAERYPFNVPADLVFIDAVHDYEHVRDDIRAWRPLIKQGGILAGHDYNPADYPGVCQAVDEAFGEAVRLDATVWSVRL